MRRVIETRGHGALSAVALALACGIGLAAAPAGVQAQEYAFDSLIPETQSRSIEEAGAAVRDAAGRLWIADPDGGRLYQYDSTGAVVNASQTLALRSGQVRLDEPYDLYATDDGTLYVLDRGAPAVYVVRDAPEQSYALGREGKDLGYFDAIRSVAVDAGGYVYVLDEDQEAVSVFNPDGRFRTWIRGGTRDFEDVVAVGVSGNGNVYVLESEGPNVHIVSPQGSPVASHRRLSSRPDVSIDEAADMTVLDNGDFLIVDRDDSRVTHFNRAGDAIGTFGGEGRPGRGVFGEAGRLAVAAGAGTSASVLDVDRKQAHTFRIAPEAAPELYSPPRLRLREPTASLPPFRDAVYAPDGTVYYIPQARTETVVARAPDADTPLFTLQVDEARSLALHENTLVVLDSDERHILTYDRIQGARVRTFGDDIPNELDKPVDVATLSDGSVLVVDEDTGMIHTWNAQGVYQSTLRPSMSRQREPLRLAVDSQDRLYIWDVAREALLQMTLEGDEVNIFQPRGQSVVERSTDTKGLLVDPLDQVHLFNRETQQYTVLAWDTSPQVLLQQGREGDAYGYDDVAAITFDPVNFVAHVVENDGTTVASIGISVRPAPPEGDLAFEAQGDTLVVAVPPVDDPAVVGYALVQSTDDGMETVATSEEPRVLLPPRSVDLSDGARTYSVVSRSPTDTSAPVLAFENLFGYAGWLYAAGKYDDALATYRNALSAMGPSPSLRTVVGERFARVGQERLQQGNTNDARRYLQAARQFAPENAVVAQALAASYTQQLRQLAQREQYDALLSTATDLLDGIDAPDLRTAMASVVDSVAGELQAMPRVRAREQAVSYYQQLVSWGAPAEQTQYALAQARASLYRLKVQTNAPLYEQEVALGDALQAAGTAVERQSDSSPHYHDARLVQLRLLLAQASYDEVIQASTQILNAQTVPVDAEDNRAYRVVQAKAYAGKGSYTEAAQVYQRLVSEAPDDTSLQMQLAATLVQTESYAEAKRIYQRLLSQQGEDPRLLMRIGQLELARGNFSEASLQLEKAIELDPDLTEAYGPLAEAYDGASNYRRAVDSYQRAIQAVDRRLASTDDPRRTQALNAALSNYRTRLARIYLQMGAYEQAIDTYQTLTQTAANAVETWYGLGSASLSAGRVYQAIDALNRAKNLAPDSERVNQQLARARAQRDQLSANRPPVEILTARINPLYPSLYRNYSDASVLPIGQVALANNTSLPMQNLRLTVYVEPLMSAPSEQNVRSLASFSNKAIPLSAVFSDAILERTQQETFQAEVVLTYRHEGSEKTVTASPTFTLYGRNAIKWEDRRRLAAFVSPQDEEIINYVKLADRTFAGTASPALPDNIKRAAQLYTVLLKEDLTYSVDPQTDFSVVSQDPTQLDFLQFPEETLQRKTGDCDDLVALYASLLQNAGMQAAYIDLPGHVMVAFDSGLSPDELSGTGLSEDNVVVALGTVWIPVEATYLEDSTFLDAWEQGVDRYRSEQAKGVVPEIVSIRDAQQVYQPAAFSLESDSLRLPASPGDLEAAYAEQIGAVYARVTRVRRAELEQQYAQSPSNLVVANELAILYAQSNRLDEAASIYDDALKQSPASALLHNNYGNVLFQQDQYAAALERYQRGLDLDADDPLIHVNIARAHLALGQVEEARAAFASATAQVPSIREAYPDLRARL